MLKVYQVCIPNTFRNSFDYLSDAPGIAQGLRVWVPFRNNLRLGVVIGEGTSEKISAQLKTIDSLIDAKPILDLALLKLCQWVSLYYQSPLSEVLPHALPKKYRLGQAENLPSKDAWQLIVSAETAHNILPKSAKKLHALIDFLAESTQKIAKKTITEAGFTRIQLEKLNRLELIQCFQAPNFPIQLSANLQQPLPLNIEQAEAVACISQNLHQYQCFLLQGITGSGKTEVYLQVAAKVLANKKQVLIVVPEIGLTPQLLARFTERFHEIIAVIHSNLNDTERQTAWQLAKEGIARLIIGTRAAIFTPLPDLGLIVIDEEHDTSLKQMEGVRYSARDTALMRALHHQIPIILGSATPSLESLHNCKLKKYQLLRLQQRALTSNPLHYQLIDIRAQNLDQGFANKTIATIETHLKQNNQILVFLNRRGYAPVLLCHQCGWMADCTACDSHLTLHRKINQLICHHCGLTQKIFTQCKACKNFELVPVGLGTQRVYDYLASRFPKASILRIDRDSVRTKHGFEEQLNKIHNGEAQLIIGTQMLAKGHHFPRLTLVVVLDADTGFFNQDFRALENLGQLLTQVAGRAGRAESRGQVLIQTHIPQHPLLHCLISQGYDAFAQELLEIRKSAELPPFHFLALIRAQAKNQALVLQGLHAMKQQLNKESVLVMGPAPAPLARKANQYRMQLLIKSSSRKKLQETLTELRTWLTINNKITAGLRWNIDVDPMDLL